ncbi:hypothetical protein BGZ94_007954 [Podila epigama]|nr:hypothetical protein BGZ94_007954 [Podila epigama]
MTDISPATTSGLSQRFRGTALPKLHLPSSNIFGLSSGHHQHVDATASSESAAAPRPFISAHPSPEFSDESSDSDHDIHIDLDIYAQHPLGPLDSSNASVPGNDFIQDITGRTKKRSDEQQLPYDELDVSHHLLLAPIPIPQSRTPPHSPMNSIKRGSLSTFNPSSVTSAPSVPISDAAYVDRIIREQVQANKASHSTKNAYFWSLGKLSEFTFSDRFVRSRVFSMQDMETNNKNENSASSHFALANAADNQNHMVPSLSGSTVSTISPNNALNATATSGETMMSQDTLEVSPSQQAHVTSSNTQSTTSSWRLRLYPHGRGDRRRDSEYVGLYLQQDATEAMAIRRKSDALSTDSSLPGPLSGRGSFSTSSRRSVSGLVLPLVRRHVTLFIATENGDCIAKQDLVEWFSGSEGGLGFPRMVSRKAVLDAVRRVSDHGMLDSDDDEMVVPELDIVAGVIFHDL